MTQMISLLRRAMCFRALPLVGAALALGACTSADRLTSSSEPGAIPASGVPTFSSDFRGGIPFGSWALPTDQFGDLYNGAMRTISPGELLDELASIKARGGKIVLSMAGNEKNFKDRDGHFSLSMWKSRIDRFRGVDFSAYIDDGTLIGHYLIDEPNDPRNWAGDPVPGSMVETMAAYSKELWPNLPAVVRVKPEYLARWGSIYRNLDAAWAQYVTRAGDPAAYIREQVGYAQKLGLALITGMNTRMGGPHQSQLSAAVVQDAGSALLADSYPCAFISWEYQAEYLARPDIRSIMESLSRKAAEHATRTCRGSPQNDPPPPPPDPEPANQPPTPEAIVLNLTTFIQNNRHYVALTWSEANGTTVDVYRNGALREVTRNDRKYVRSYVIGRTRTFTYQVCETGTSRCSNSVTAQLD
jgi:hypothetical protein